MKPEAQRISIAEACGWIRDERCNNWKKPSEGPYAVAFMNEWIQHRQLPDYLKDLNEMHEAEYHLTPPYLDRYADILCDMTATGDPDPNITSLLTLTAAQKAEAFLKALNLWQD